MPPVLAVIPALISGVTTGMQIAGVGQPSPGDAAKQAQEAALKQAQQDSLAKQKALLAALPNAQEQAGGVLNAPSLTDLASVIAGLPGESNTAAGKGALSAFLGTGQGTGTTGATGTSQPPQNMIEATFGLSGSQG